MSDFQLNNDFFQSDLAWLEGSCQFQPDDSQLVSENSKTMQAVKNSLHKDEFASQFTIGGSQVTYSFKQSKETIDRIKLSQALRILKEKEQGIFRPCSEEKKQLLRIANLGKKSSMETRQKISAKSRNQVHTDETKQKISQVHKGKTVSAETRGKISAANQARKSAGYIPRELTDSEREKIGAAHRGKVVSEETRAKLRAFNLGRKKGVPKSPETIARMKEAAALRWANRSEESRKRNPEATAKMKATKLAKKLALQVR